jgi:hypothetical protein
MLSHPMTKARRLVLIAISLAATAGGVSACGEQGISASLSDDNRRAAEIFVERCSGCHTFDVAGTEGSTTNIRTREYKDGPNFNQRKVTENCALYAIRNGGFSSGPMPQDIVVGEDAVLLARFIAEYSGGDIEGVEDAGADPSSQSAGSTDCPAG